MGRRRGSVLEKRCLSFRVHEESNFSLDAVKGFVPSWNKEYYSLQQDPEEKVDDYISNQGDPILASMKDRLKRYRTEPAVVPSQRKPQGQTPEALRLRVS